MSKKMVSTRSKKYSLANKQEREEVKENLDRTFNELKTEDKNLQEMDAWSEQVQTNLQSILAYVEGNEIRLNNLESQCNGIENDRELLNSNINDVRKTVENLDNLYKALELKINNIEKIQDEKMEKEIGIIREEYTKNLTEIKEKIVISTERHRTSDREINEIIKDAHQTEINLQQGVDYVKDLTSQTEDVIYKKLEKMASKMLNTNFQDLQDKMFDCIIGNNDKLKDFEINLCLVDKNLTETTKNLEIVTKEKEISDMKLNVLEQTCEKLVKENKILVHNNQVFEKEIIKLKTKEERTSHVKFNEENIRASSRLRSLSPIKNEQREYDTPIIDSSRNIQNMSNISMYHRKRLEAPIFKGDKIDKPMKFLKEMRQYLSLEDMNQNDLKLTLSRSLEGNASAWWDIIESSVRTFDEFERKFQERFWNEAITDEIEQKIDSGVYHANGKLNRVDYTINLMSKAQDIGKYTEKELIRKLANHHDMDIRFAVRAQKIEDRETFLSLLACKDIELKREKKQKFNENKQTNESKSNERITPQINKPYEQNRFKGTHFQHNNNYSKNNYSNNYVKNGQNYSHKNKSYDLNTQNKQQTQLQNSTGAYKKTPEVRTILLDEEEQAAGYSGNE